MSHAEQLEALFQRRKTTPFNINEHLQTLRDLADQCDHVTEIGTERGFSTSAHLSSKAARFHLIDICITPEAQQLVELARLAGKDVDFEECPSLEARLEKTDYLFIDGLHTYQMVRDELFRFAGITRKFIALHDTVLFGTFSQTPHGSLGAPPGLLLAIEEFLGASPEWRTRAVFHNNNGLVVLERAA